MAEIQNFKLPGDFLNHNDQFIYGHYFQHYNLIKIIEQLRMGNIQLIDAFNIVDDECFIISMSTEVGWLIYSNGWTDECIDKLYERIDFSRFSNFQFSGQRKLLIELFEKFELPYLIEKDRLVYECNTVRPTSLNVSGSAVPSLLKDLDKLTQLMYEYSNEEWGVREGRGLEFFRELASNSIQNQSHRQWEDNGEICAIAQIMNLHDDFPFVGSLYTEKSKRNKGYATALLSDLTKEVLENGYEGCGLISDVSNPSSNLIFKKVGYEPIYEFIILQQP